MIPKTKVVVIVGSTSSGKSDLAVLLAKRFSAKGGPASGWKGAEVISADSRQVYKGMDIGSGKVPRDKSKSQFKSQNYLYKGIPHYLLDVISPKKTFTVVQYQKLAKKAIQKILEKGRLPIICGGTGFYIDSLLYNWKIPEVPPQRNLREKLSNKSTGELFKMLSGLDPQRAAVIDKNNKVRLIRALEIILATGSPVPKFEPFKKKNSPYNFLKIGIKISNEELKNKIHARLLKRLKQGMISEVWKLHKQGVSWKRLDDFGLEYRWISRYLRGSITEDEMTQTLEKEIRRYAKRQMTWFKRDKNTIWLSDTQKASAEVQGFLGRGVRP